MTSLTIERPTFQRATTLEMVARAASATLPAGVIGQVEGVALVYDVIDTYGTTFARGCLDRTVRERVAAGKVKLYWDHGDATRTGVYDTHLHIGTVREVRDQQLPDGTWGAVFRADLFDTEPGREAHEYLRAIAATGSETGVSIGMMFLPEPVRAVIDGKKCERFTEVPLREISITGESAVPGTRVTTVRADAANVEMPKTLTFEFGDYESAPAPIDYTPILTGIRAALGPEQFRALTERISGNAQPTDSDAASGTPAATDSDAGPVDSQPTPTEGVRTNLVPMSDRLLWSRQAFARLYPQ